MEGARTRKIDLAQFLLLRVDFCFLYARKINATLEIHFKWGSLIIYDWQWLFCKPFRRKRKVLQFETDPETCQLSFFRL